MIAQFLTLRSRFEMRAMIDELRVKARSAEKDEAGRQECIDFMDQIADRLEALADRS